MNFLRTLQNTVPGKKISTIAESMTSRFKGMYRQFTDAVHKSTAQPTLLPYIPQEAVEKKTEPSTREHFSSAYHSLRERINERALEEAKTEKRSRYKQLLNMQDTIESVSDRIASAKMHQLQKKVLESVNRASQEQLKKEISTDLALKSHMTKDEVKSELLSKGYRRMERGVGYVAVYNALEKEDRLCLDPDGSMWVHADIVAVAQSSENTDSVLHACWDMIEEGRTPIFHMSKLMQIAGYETAPKKQVQYSYARSHADRSYGALAR